MVRRNPVTSTGTAFRRRAPLMEQRGARKARVQTVPPPVGGWNVRDALSQMKPTDAVFLDNWFPRQSDVVTRPGYSEHCDTSELGDVSQLIIHEYQAGLEMVAATNGKLINVTTATPSELATGFTNDDWSYDWLSGLTLLANGADAVRSYDGTSIASPAFTGVTLSNLNHVSVYKSRAYFVEKDTTSMWYGATGAVAGALTEFDFSGVASVEGDLCFTTHLKGDGGDGGQDDVFVAVFKGGDVLAYTGSNPGDPTDWSLVGHYKVGRPLGRLAYTRADDDVYMITDRGYEQLSRMVKFGDSYKRSLLLSDKIQKAVLERISTLGPSDDWRVTIYPKGQMLIMTVPGVASSRSYHVLNINTGAWCRFKDFIAHSWAMLGGNLYFGGQTGVVYAFDDGSFTDNGTRIRADCQQAWTHLQSPGVVKQLQLVKPFFFATKEPSVSINAGANYSTITLAPFSSGGSAEAAIWDQGIWDTAIWTFPERTFTSWYSRNAVGEAIGVRVAIDATEQTVRWNQTTMTYTVGGYL